VISPSDAERRALSEATDNPSLGYSACDVRMGLGGSGDGLTHATNIFPAGYEFEGGAMAIS
jgi:hypothetical protein